MSTQQSNSSPLNGHGINLRKASGRAYWLGAALLAAAFVGGCKSGASVTVDIRVPRPLVDPLAVQMGVYFDDTLKSYVHEEQLEDYGIYRIDIGASQAPVFAQVFDAMFEGVVAVLPEAPGELAQGTTPQPDAESDAATEPASESTTPVLFRPSDDGQPAFDGILVPSIDEVQFAIPDQTGGEFYEVWIRYRMRLFAADGGVLGDWPVIGYGKANQRNYGSLDQTETGLNEATIWALRDAAAWLSFQFRDQSEVQSWLASLEGTP